MFATTHLVLPGSHLEAGENNYAKSPAGSTKPAHEERLFQFLHQENKEEVAALLRGLVFLDDENNYSNALYQFALRVAAEAGLIDEVKGLTEILLRNGGDIDARNSPDGLTALHAAAGSGRAEVVQYFLERLSQLKENISVNKMAEFELRQLEALELAVENGDVETVKAFHDFLSSGASNIDEAKKNDLLKLAARNEHWEIASFLFDDFESRFVEIDKKINEEENEEENNKMAAEIVNTLVDVLHSAAERGNFDESVTNFIEKVVSAVDDSFGENAIVLFKQEALVALNFSSMNVFKVLWDKFVSNFGYGQHDDYQLNIGIQSLVGKAASNGNLEALQMMKISLETKGIDLFQVLAFEPSGIMRKVEKIFAEDAVYQNTLKVEHNAVTVG